MGCREGEGEHPSALSTAEPRRRACVTKPAGESVPQHMRATFETIVALTDAFCKEWLTDEYADLCRKLAAALARKRPSPLLSGNLNTWACGVVYTIASLNFLFDKSAPNYVSAADLAGAFGLAKNTAGAKSKAIRDALKIRAFDWHWAAPSRLDDYPGAWLIQVNELIVDARRMPREIQEEAFRKGYIPYVP
jgi:hypothetical protein